MFRIYRNSDKLGLLVRTGHIRLKNGFTKASSSLPSAAVIGETQYIRGEKSFTFFGILENTKPKQTFDELIRSRKEEAGKSIVVQVNSEKSYPELFRYCSQFGTIKNAFHYKIVEAQNDFILFEFQNTSECEETLSNCDFHDDKPGIPTASRFLWFKASASKQTKETLQQKPPILFSDSTRLVKEESLIELLQSAESIEDQMLVLYRSTHLTDLGTRLRFLAAKQIETALEGMFPEVQAHPFGSSVNGFGKMGCDLDLILQFQPDMRAPSKNRLIFHTRSQMSNSRQQIQRQMETLGDIMHLFLPGIAHVRKILQARVPIIKYNHECLDLEVDLSMGNTTGLYMSELLYLFGEIDERVKPLTFCLRKWASATGLTNPSPGHWITNFSLTLLVLFFLQNLKTPILPSFNSMIKSATADDIRITEDNINCTFLRDLSRLNFQRKNGSTLSDLLVQFFEFYSQFDFKNSAVSMLEGKPIPKTDFSAIWIVNPLEPTLNVSKNINFEELERFKFQVKNAAWILESTSGSKQKAEASEEDSWGLLNLFRTSKQPIVKPQMFYKSRLVDVSELFSGDPEPIVRFKNKSIESEVNAIRQSTKRQINKLELSKMKSKRK